jgi:hypothetical protein
MTSPTRIALLIGAPGGLNSTFLPGVESDIQNVQSFLMSAHGGAWHDDEIIILNDPDKAEVFLALQYLFADYVIVYFSGHGFQDQKRRNFLSLTNGEYVEDILFLNETPRQLICSNIIPLPISGVPPFLGEDFRYGDPEELKLSRKLYDNWINNCLPGKVILHSTGAGTSSYDTPTGGVFTKTLLRIGNTFCITQISAKLDILSSAKYVMPDLANQGSEQIPSKTYLEGNGNLPFAIAPENILRYKVKPKVARRSNSRALVALGLLGLGLYLASED